MEQIYKYLPPERVKFLEDALLRFTPPGALNDPFECLPALSAETAKRALSYAETLVQKPVKLPDGLTRMERRSRQREIEKATANAYKELRENYREVFYKKAADNMNSQIGILSLSRRWNSALMWSHYTNAYEGFCVGFRRSHKFFNYEEETSPNRTPLLPVIYSQQRTLVPGGRPTPPQAVSIVLTKSKDWEYEQEERVMDYLSEAKITIDASPFKIALFEVPHDAVTELIIGMRAQPSLRKLVRDASKRLKVPLYETKVSDTSFDVERFRTEG